MEMKDRTRSKRLFLLAVTLVLATVLGTAGLSYAISNGQPDDDGHPYVAAVGGLVNGEWFFCSAAAISPTILVTAAHCFETPGQEVLITFDPEGPVDPESDIVLGHWFPHLGFCLGCGPGLPGFDTNDVAVVVLDQPFLLNEYAELPTEGLVDTLPMGTEVTVVGYGVQEFTRGGGPPQRVFSMTRYFAPSKLIASKHKHSDEYIKLTANPAQGKGGVCFGDSGGPNLLEGTSTILAINSYLTNYNCTGVTYSKKLGTLILTVQNV
jgi:secreted trypsin-like serine protease